MNKTKQMTSSIVSATALAALATLAAGGCAVDEPITSELADESISVQQTQVFYEKWDALNTGHVDGQNGWTSTGCQVFLDGAGPNKYAKCQNGEGASRATDSYGGAGTYHLLLDTWPNVNVTASTAAKLILTGPSGIAMQIIVGCDNIGAAYQALNRVNLLSFPCTGGGDARVVPRYRVKCDWTTGTDSLRCGAAVYPNDPASGAYRHISTGPMRSFNQVQLVTFPGPGAVLFDKIHIARD